MRPATALSRAPLPPPGPLYAIADAEALSPARLPVAVTALAEAGVSWIQVRAKGLADDDLYRLLEETCEGLHRGGHRHVRLWVNDRADLATLFPVAGLHLGQTDLPPTAARTVVGSEVWIGLSTHDEAQLEAAARDPDVDVVAVGPVFPTTGKRDPDPVVGLDLVRRAREVTAKTVVAIGGIGEDGLAAVIAAGADTAAVLGGLGRDAVGERARLLLLAVRRGIS